MNNAYACINIAKFVERIADKKSDIHELKTWFDYIDFFAHVALTPPDFLLDFRNIFLTYIWIRRFFSRNGFKRGIADGSCEYSISRRTCSLFDSDNMGVSDFNLSICEIRRGVRLLFNISNISSQYSPFVPDPSLVWRVTGCFPYSFPPPFLLSHPFRVNPI